MAGTKEDNIVFEYTENLFSIISGRNGVVATFPYSKNLQDNYNHHIAFVHANGQSTFFLDGVRIENCNFRI